MFSSNSSIWLTKLPNPDPLVEKELARVGLVDVLQQIPLAVTGDPPSAVTSPPDVADVCVIFVIAVVMTVGRFGACSVVNDMLCLFRTRRYVFKNRICA